MTNCPSGSIISPLNPVSAPVPHRSGARTCDSRSLADAMDLMAHALASHGRVARLLLHFTG